MVLTSALSPCPVRPSQYSFALAPGADWEKDLLFLTAFETATHTPAGGYRRVTMKQ